MLEHPTWFDRIAKINPVYGEAWATAGHFFIINRRYDEGIAAYRKAIAVDPDLWDARAELGVNLMRMGQEDRIPKAPGGMLQLGRHHAGRSQHSQAARSL